MDLGDLFSAAPPPGQGKTTGDQLAELLGMMVFPFLTFLLVAQGFTVGVVLLPAAFAGLTFFLGMRFKGRPGAVGFSTFFCVLACFVAGVLGSVLAGL